MKILSLLTALLFWSGMWLCKRRQSKSIDHRHALLLSKRWQEGDAVKVYDKIDDLLKIGKREGL